MAKDKNFEIEYLKLENEKLKNQISSKQDIISEKELMVLIGIASDMRELLEECRYQQIELRLARKIDAILARARELD